MTENKFKIKEEDIMINVFFHKASGQFSITELTEQGRNTDDVAEPGDWEDWSDYMEPSEFYEKLREIFSV